jgi:hypothetical protein
MAYIKVLHKVPDGNKCTVKKGDGILGSNYEHCLYRTSTYIPDEKRALSQAAVKAGTYRSIDFLEVRCRLFGVTLNLDQDDELPYKCKRCLEATE